MEFFQSVIGWVGGNIPELLQIVGGFAIIATMTPNKADDAIVGWILKAINFMGANTGKAANSE